VTEKNIDLLKNGSTVTKGTPWSLHNMSSCRKADVIISPC